MEAEVEGVNGEGSGGEHDEGTRPEVAEQRGEVLGDGEAHTTAEEHVLAAEEEAEQGWQPHQGHGGPAQGAAGGKHPRAEQDADAAQKAPEGQCEGRDAEPGVDEPMGGDGAQFAQPVLGADVGTEHLHPRAGHQVLVLAPGEQVAGEGHHQIGTEQHQEEAEDLVGAFIAHERLEARPASLADRSS